MEAIKKMDDLKLDEYLPSPFEEIEGLESRETKRLEREGKLKFVGDDMMMSSA